MLGRWRPLAALTLVAVLGCGVAACGDDDDESGDTGTATTDAGGDGEQASGGDFCDSFVAFNESVFQVEIDDETPEEDVVAAGEQLKPLFDDVVASAPDSLSGDVDEIASVIDDLTQGDATAFNEDATFEKYLALTNGVVDECSFEEATVTAVDYEFQNVPEDLSAGTQAITLDNQSEADEEHEFVIFRKADGETRSAEELLNDPAAAEEGPGEFVGVAFAPPGESASSLIELEAGDYIAACFVPLGGDESSPPHFTQGMFTEFSVA